MIDFPFLKRGKNVKTLIILSIFYDELGIY